MVKFLKNSTNISKLESVLKQVLSKKDFSSLRYYTYLKAYNNSSYPQG